MKALSKKDIQKVYPARFRYTAETQHLANLILDELWDERNAERLTHSFDRAGSCKFAALLARDLFGGRLVGNAAHVFVVRRGKTLDLNLHQSDVAHMGDAAHDQDPFALLHDDYRESLASCMPRVRRWIKEFEDRVPAGARLEVEDVDNLIKS